MSILIVGRITIGLLLIPIHLPLGLYLLIWPRIPNLTLTVFFANQQMVLANDTASVLETAVKTLSDPNISHTKRNEVLKIKTNGKSIIPLQPLITDVHKKAADDF